MTPRASGKDCVKKNMPRVEVLNKATVKFLTIYVDENETTSLA